ncbi:mCG147839 [Mus musculus]|jgi:hypothetical protein|nr:mCG147839 [Mus musculus]
MFNEKIETVAYTFIFVYSAQAKAKCAINSSKYIQEKKNQSINHNCFPEMKSISSFCINLCFVSNVF